MRSLIARFRPVLLFLLVLTVPTPSRGQTIFHVSTAAGLNAGGRIAVLDSTVHVHASQFVNNRVNFPGHENISRGGAIQMGGGKLRVTNTRFEGNQAGH
jgi:hypothetical protein